MFLRYRQKKKQYSLKYLIIKIAFLKKKISTNDPLSLFFLL